jgi:hypothetical protein
MRTTVTVDQDAELLLHEAMRQTGQSFKVVLNQAIRKGLAGTVITANEEPFVVVPQSMGLRAGIDATQLQQFGDELEIDAFLELTRKLLQTSPGSP